MMMNNATLLIARSVWIDFSRRKDFFVVATMLLLFAVSAAAARMIGVVDESAARLLLSCGLGLASSLSAVLVALFAARILPEEFESRTLYPLLAKPVSRAQMLWAKWLGVISMGILSLLLFVALAWLPVPRPAAADSGLLAQAVVLQVLSMSGLCWMAMWLSIRLPSLVSAMVSLALWFLAGSLTDFTVNLIGGSSKTLTQAAAHLAAIVPDWSSLRFFQAYVEGAPALAAGAFVSLVIYGAAFAGLFALLSIQTFERKPL